MAALSGAAALLALLVAIDALDTGQAVFPTGLVTAADTPPAYWLYLVILTLGGLVAAVVFAFAVWTLIDDLTADRRADTRLPSRRGGGVKPRPPRPPRSP